MQTRNLASVAKEFHAFSFFPFQGEFEAVQIADEHFLQALDNILPQDLTEKSAPKAAAYLPMLLAQIFECGSSDLVAVITEANLCMDYFTHTIDDLTDGDNVDTNALHAGQLMLGRSLRLYSSIVGDNETFMTYWERYLVEASEAERFLLRHRSPLPYRDEDLKMIGRKSALLKTCAAAFGCRTGRHDVVAGVESLLETVAVAVQLMDDLRDCEEDNESGFYSYPLALSYARKGSELSLHKKTLDAITVVQTLALARAFLGRSLEICFRFEAEMMVEFVGALRTSITTLEKDVPDLVEAGDQIRFDKLQRKLTERIHPRMDH
jgi:hypothetical protein